MSIEYVRVPKKVIALQFFPHANLPGVKQVVKVVDSTPDGYGTQPQQVVTSGVVVLRGRAKPWKVDPSDYVIYDYDTMEPVDAMSSEQFSESFVSKAVFDICPACQEKADALSSSTVFKTAEDYKKAFEDGRGPIPIKTKKGVVFAYTYNHFLNIVKEDQATPPAV